MLAYYSGYTCQQDLVNSTCTFSLRCVDSVLPLHLHLLACSTTMICTCIRFLQPKSFFPATSRTGIYEITDVCNHESRAFLRIPSERMSVRCDMESDGGGWTVIQRRVNGGTVNFRLDWEAYEQGFGDLEGEFWLGLLNIHCLTTREEVELRIDMQNASGAQATWTYQEFRVDGPEDNYRLHIGQGEGTTGSFDAMAYHNNWPFTTHDRDNDGRRSGNCAGGSRINFGGWWYNYCYHATLNGVHSTNYLRWWITSSSTYFYPTSVEMKVRAKGCKIE